MATLLGMLYETFEFEEGILDIKVAEVKRVICCFSKLVYTTEPKILGQSPWNLVGSPWVFGMSTLFGKLYETFEFEACMDI